MTGRDIRLIAVDLDGTLLNDRKEVPPDFIPMVEALYPRGIRFVLASGRQYYNLAAMVEPVADKLFYFAENGGLIFDGADIISCSPIPEDMLRELRRAGAEIGAPLVMSGVKSAYIAADCGPAARENTAMYYRKRTFADDPLAAAKAAGDSIVKVAVFDAEDAATKCEPRFAQFRPRLKVTLAGQSWVDVMRADVNKGLSLEFLQERLGIAPDQCMAFGDYPNDLEMIRQAGFSYAMANSHPDLLAAAKYRAPSNEEDGVMRVLRETFPDALPG